MNAVWQDFRYAFRILFKKPGFALTAVVALALGIGANTAIFTIVNAVLIRPLALPNPERLMQLSETLPTGGTGTLSVLDLRDWREQSRSFKGIAAYTGVSYNLKGKDSPERIDGAAVSPNYFQVMGVQPMLGRAFLPGEDTPGRNLVAVLDESLWRSHFAADLAILEKTVVLNGQNFTIVGVMPGSFGFPRRDIQIWTPYTPDAAAQNRGSHFLFTVARLKPGVPMEAARTEIDGIERRLARQYPETSAGRGATLVSLPEATVRNVRQTLFVLLGAVAFVFLIACANVANLLLARASERQKEIAIRSALGAGRKRIVRQFLAESLLLCMTGGALGWIVALWSVDLLVRIAGGALPRAAEIAPDARVLAFTLLISTGAALALALTTALRFSGSDLQDTLKDAAKATVGLSRSHIRSALVVAEVAISLVLLIGAGLMIESFWKLRNVDPGFRSDRVLTMRLALPDSKYSERHPASAFYDEALERVRTLPGVEAAGLITLLPDQEWGMNGDYESEGHPNRPGQAPVAEFRAVSGDYFHAMRIPLLEGRTFSRGDLRDAAKVVIVNRALAEKCWPGQSAVGKRIRFDNPKWATVAGVVGDVRQSGLEQVARPEIYIHHAQSEWGFLTLNMSLVVRTASEPASLAGAVRRQIQAVDPDQPVYLVKTMEEVVAESVSNQRLGMTLLGIFAALALLLAALGIYGVMAYIVRQRTREIGIRMALGARVGDVLRMAIAQGMKLAGIGLLIGLGGALLVTRVLSSLLYGVSATDPLTFLAVPIFLALIALLAIYFPARRAARIDPMAALHHE